MNKYIKVIKFETEDKLIIDLENKSIKGITTKKNFNNQFKKLLEVLEWKK